MKNQRGIRMGERGKERKKGWMGKVMIWVMPLSHGRKLSKFPLVGPISVTS